MTVDLRSRAQARSRSRRALLSASVVGLAACGAGTVVSVSADSASRTIVATAGQEIHVTLGNVGPGTYVSPPSISSGAVTFLGVEVVPPYTPAGPTQRFRFKAVSNGQAIVVFRRIRDDAVVSIVEDTVQVR